jgi:hypothetical protein
MSATRSRLRGIVEIIGLAGLIASLVFVGLEVSQNAAATRAATAQEISSSFRDINLMMAGDAEFSEMLVSSSQNPEDAPPVDQARLRSFFRALFHIWSNVYYQNLNGTVDDQIYDGMVSEVSAYARSGFRAPFWAWESARFIYPVQFRTFMDSIAATAASGPDRAALDSLGQGSN